MENQFFTEKYDDEFKKIESENVYNKKVFERFPRMMPMVGADYDKQPAKILLVLESYYFDNDDAERGSVFQNEEDWYKTKDAILIPKSSESEDKKKKTSESKVNMHEPWIYDLKKAGPFPNIFRAMQAVKDGDFKVQCQSIAIYDYFLRPAYGGKKNKGFKGICKQIDKDVAFDTFCGIVDVLKPDVVIFLSKFSHETFHKYNKTFDNITIETITHPSSAWWNRDGGSYGREPFINLLKRYWLKPIEPKIKAESLKLLDDFKANPIWNKEKWGDVIWWDDNYGPRFYFDHIENNIAIDVYSIGNDKYQFQVFERDKFKNTKKSNIEWIKSVPNLTLNGTRYESQPLSLQELKSILAQIMK